MNVHTATTKFYGLLDLKRRAVGIKLVRSDAEYQACTATELFRPLPYCVAVKCAMAGRSIKQSRETSGCPGANRALGLTEPSPHFFSGAHGHALGLFESESVAAQVAASLPICPASTCGVIVMPLEQFEADPDVVLMVARPGTIMRILQGYAYRHGLPEGMHLSGNQAVCVECTITPLINNGINVSMLCSGTRYRARWEDSECMVGIAFTKFFDTVRGIERTLNAVESDARKQVIETRLAPSNALDVRIEYGKNYYKKQK